MSLYINNFNRMLKTAVFSTFKFHNVKNIHISALLRLREIVVTQKDSKTTEIEARYIPSPREPYLLKYDKNSDKCVLCQLQLNIKHTDVLILSQFLTSSGEVMKRADIGICRMQYKYIKNLIYMAQHAGLLPEGPRLSPKKPYHLLNTYYDENTIVLQRKKRVLCNKLHKLTLGPIEKFRVRPELGVGHLY